MTRVSKRVTGLAVAATAAAMGLAACSSSSSSGSAAGAPTATSSAKPVSGGTLNIVAASGPDHMDTVPAYYTADYELERAYTRQLVAYPSAPAASTSDAGWTQSVTPVADIATEVPTTANGGITDGGKVYTFHIKPGVMWDTTPARQVTAADFVREFKAFFNPVSPVGNAVYYTSTIAGLSQYSAAETSFFANAKKEPPTAANIANFQNTHTISGIKAVDATTLQFTLIQPASDFIYMLAMPFASARPVEYDSYVPNSLQLDTHLISDGPYSVSSYVAGKSITMVRNPAWKQSTDTLRHDYVNEIVLTEGVTSAQTQLSDIQAGTQDLTNDTPVNPSSIPSLAASKVPNFVIYPWSDTFPYLVFNLRSPNSGGAAQKQLVRAAVEYGLDKTAVLKAAGGPDVGTLINTVIPPGNLGYQNTNLYPDNNGTGNTAACKSDLTKAGYPHGVTLTYLYINDSANTRIFTAIQASLANCGITLNGKGEPGSSFFVDLGNAPENNKPGSFDIGQAGWIPDWYGNNGRTVIQALFQGPQCVVNTVNYGCYDNATVNSLITKAEAATSLSAAGADWQAADEQIMKDAAIVPIMSQTFPQIASKRVRGVLPNGSSYQTAIFAPNIGNPDITNVWLAS
ncbi:MAG TPA: ABC transporter substrate-binding protein [Trebonia sp.]|nr:ABC transporter substrate-binding protein [Trebonia sp.]